MCVSPRLSGCRGGLRGGPQAGRREPRAIERVHERPQAAPIHANVTRLENTLAPTAPERSHVLALQTNEALPPARILSPMAVDIRLPLGPAREDIAAELRRLHGAAGAFWASLPEERFFTPLGPGWSPADTVRHLTKSIRPVALALRLPPLVLRGLFGRSTAPSRDYASVRAAYRQVLAAGGQAGRFAPAPLPPVTAPVATRARLMARHEAAVDALARAVVRWPERELDRCRLPHPLMGKLNVREMLWFTLYHTVHHVAIVERRLAASSPAPGVE